MIAHQFSTRLHRKAKHRVLSEDRTQALCNACATGVQRRRFYAVSSLLKAICECSKKLYKYWVFGVLSKEGTGPFKPGFVSGGTRFFTSGLIACAPCGAISPCKKSRPCETIHRIVSRRASSPVTTGTAKRGRRSLPLLAGTSRDN